LKEHEASNDELQKVRAKALDAVKNALRLQPKVVDRLRELLHGSANPIDNDLKIFENDEDFKKLIDVGSASDAKVNPV
jgi:hypothetical protein